LILINYTKLALGNKIVKISNIMKRRSKSSKIPLMYLENQDMIWSLVFIWIEICIRFRFKITMKVTLVEFFKHLVAVGSQYMSIKLF